MPSLTCWTSGSGAGWANAGDAMSRSMTRERIAPPRDSSNVKTRGSRTVSLATCPPMRTDRRVHAAEGAMHQPLAAAGRYFGIGRREGLVHCASLHALYDFWRHVRPCEQ